MTYSAMPDARPASPNALYVLRSKIVNVGFLMAAFFLIIGYALLVGLLDETCCPPLEAQGNFGQFGFLVVVIAPLVILAGATFLLIPYLAWWLWLPIYLLVVVFMHALTGIVAPWHSNPLHVTNVALYIIGIVFGLVGVAARLFYGYRKIQIEADERTSPLIAR